jgi:hypothetical protein
MLRPIGAIALYYLEHRRAHTYKDQQQKRYKNSAGDYVPTRHGAL